MAVGGATGVEAAENEPFKKKKVYAGGPHYIIFATGPLVASYATGEWPWSAWCSTVALWGGLKSICNEDILIRTGL
jgi:hypothetical protein